MLGRLKRVKIGGTALQIKKRGRERKKKERINLTEKG